MDDITQLLIRACKRMDSTKRLLRVYRRFYLPGTQDEEYQLKALACILAPLVEKYCPLSVSECITSLEESPYRSDSYAGRAVGMLRDKIAFTGAAEFPGLRKPAWLKNKYERNEL